MVLGDEGEDELIVKHGDIVVVEQDDAVGHGLHQSFVALVVLVLLPVEEEVVAILVLTGIIEDEHHTISRHAEEVENEQLVYESS